MRVVLFAVLSLFSTTIWAQDAGSQQDPILTADQINNLLGANLKMAETFIDQALTVINTSNAAFNLLLGAQRVHQRFMNNLFGDVDNCTFDGLGALLPSTDSSILIHSLAYIETLFTQGSKSILTTDPPLNITDVPTVVDAFNNASLIATMAAVSGNITLDPPDESTIFAVFEYMQVVKQLQFNCTTQDLGLNNSLLSGIQSLGFTSPFAPNHLSTHSNISDLCPTDAADCSCQSFVNDISVPVEISPPHACVLAAGVGINMMILTRDSTPLSRDPNQRILAQSENGTYLAGPVMFIGK